MMNYHIPTMVMKIQVRFSIKQSLFDEVIPLTYCLLIDILPNNEIFSRDSLFLGEEDDPACDEEDDQPCDADEEEEDDIIILHIDIREPIKRLKKLLEQKIAINLSKYEFWLQDAQIV